MRKKFMVLLLAALTLVTSFTLGITIAPSASANNHQSTLSFSASWHEGPWRNYTHSHIQWFATVSSTASPSNSTFNIALYRRNGTGHGYRFGGSQRVTRNGLVMIHWNNVGAGSRRFRYEKANDGHTISSPNVIMSSSNTQYVTTMGLR
ncbi:MAG: hypothetical protein FWC20_08230 [Oscillospiraceae bacterium]|nr:hypothetical protein [Oscillospiraceae bacterium]MCL2279373.1 hypothetical protein [Oscillospiraceae bacterium]